MRTKNIYLGAAEQKQQIQTSIENFNWIRDGLKTIEGRPYHKKYKIGDTLIFKNKNESISAKITDIRLYETLEHFLHNEGIREVLPCATTMQAAIQAYNKLSSEHDRNSQLKKYGHGFMAIQIKLD